MLDETAMRLLNDYKRHMQSECKAPQTIRSTLNNIKIFMRNTPDLINATAQDIISHFSRKNIKAQTQYSYYMFVKNFYVWMLESDRILSSPVGNVKTPISPNRSSPSKVMTQGEALKTLNVFSEDSPDCVEFRNRLIMELLYTCSLRRSEVASLNCNDYDPLTNSLIIRPSKTGRGRLLPVGKKASEMLKVYLESKRAEIYLIWRTGRAKEAEKNYRAEKGTQAIFINRIGLRIAPNDISCMVRKARKKAGIRTKATSHSFRKSSATHMLKNGASLENVQGLLGHSYLDSTRVYTKIYPRDITKMLKSKHPRERQKNLQLPTLAVPVDLLLKKG